MFTLKFQEQTFQTIHVNDFCFQITPHRSPIRKVKQPMHKNRLLRDQAESLCHVLGPPRLERLINQENDAHHDRHHRHLKSHPQRKTKRMPGRNAKHSRKSRKRKPQRKRKLK